MPVHLQTRWGDSIANPSESQMRSALDELDTDDPEHPDCSLTDEHGWSLAVFSSGLLIWENVEDDTPPRHLRGIPRETVLNMWRSLSNGRHTEIESHPWRPGHG